MWLDKTMLVLESRRAKSKGSIKEAFFGFGERNAAKMTPQSADCYSCREAHAAVDTTFVQFYPSLLLIAQEKGTLRPEYKKDTGQ